MIFTSYIIINFLNRLCRFSHFSNLTDLYERNYIEQFWTTLRMFILVGTGIYSFFFPPHFKSSNSSCKACKIWRDKNWGGGSVYVRVNVCVSVCVCLCEREMSVSVSVSVWGVCVCMSVSEIEECVCVYVCVRERDECVCVSMWGVCACVWECNQVKKETDERVRDA